MPTFVRLLLGCFLLSSLPGCFVFSFERPLEQDTGVIEEDTFVPPDRCEGFGDPDEGMLPCRPPSSADNNLNLELTYAIEAVMIDQQGVEPMAGLDLDGVDSSLGAPSEGVGECTPATPSFDGPHGVDNVLGRDIWHMLGGEFPTLDCEIESAHRRGLGTLLIRITNWNGLPDDPQVDAFLAPSVLGTHQPSWTSREDAQAASQGWTWGMENVELEPEKYPEILTPLPFAEISEGVRPDEPCWDDEKPYDWYFANRSAFSITSVAKVRSNVAYIADDWLVVPLPDRAEFQLFTDRRGVEIPLVQGYILAKISMDRTHFERAFIAGRFLVDDLVRVGEPMGFCFDGEILRDLYGDSADLFAMPGRDVPQETPCVWVERDEEGVVTSVIDAGAMSVGVGFTGRRVNYGGLAPVSATWEMPHACETFNLKPDGPAHCTPGWTFSPPGHCNDE